MNRVAITGMGAVCAAGRGVDSFLSALLEAKSLVRRVTRFDPSMHRSQIAAEVPVDLDEALAQEDPQGPDSLPRVGRYLLAAAREAIDDSELDPSGLSPERSIGWLGTSAAAIEEYGRLLISDSRARGPEGVASLLAHLPGGLAREICLRVGFPGTTRSASTGCTAAIDAAGLGFESIRAGARDVALVLSADAGVHPITMYAFDKIHALSRQNEKPAEASRPFDLNRDGFVMGEGAGAILLENLEHARRRGARIYGEITGFGSTCDAHHMTNSHPDRLGGRLAIQAALRDGDTSPEAIGYVGAHGSSTPINDRVETQLIHDVFGAHARNIAISSVKSVIGHLNGAAGLMALIASALAYTHGVLPPTANYQVPDPDCDLDYIPNVPRWVEVDGILVNSFAFSGKNSCLILRRFDASRKA